MFLNIYVWCRHGKCAEWTKKRTLKFILLLSAVLFSLGVKIVKAPTIKFCPGADEEDIRERLKIGNVPSLTKDEFFRITFAHNYRSDKKKFDKPYKCKKQFMETPFESYKIYTGWSEDRSHLKDYLIVINEDGYVTHIETRSQYPPPFLEPR